MPVALAARQVQGRSLAFTRRCLAPSELTTTASSLKPHSPTITRKFRSSVGRAGVRQGGVLSPVLFAVFMDTLIERLRRLGLGCRISDQFYGCLLYADDILLLSHSANAMRRMLMIRSLIRTLTVVNL